MALGSSILDDDETYDLTNIGTLFAFFVVCLGVLALRIRDPQRPRPFRVPFVWLVAPLGAALCVVVMLGLPKTAFNFCTFWLIEALHLSGRTNEARQLFEEMVGRRTTAGLLSEDIAPESGELWGNFPQTYSMVGVIGSALRLSRSWEEIV